MQIAEVEIETVVDALDRGALIEGQSFAREFRLAVS